MKAKYPKCHYCGGAVVGKTIEWDYRRNGKHLIFQNVPAGVCSQCGEKYFRPEVSKKMDHAFRRAVPTQHIKIPVIAFKAA